MNEAIALANDAAAEHLVVGTSQLARRVVNAGAVFVGAGPRRSRAITRSDPITCCRPPAPRGFAAA